MRTDACDFEATPPRSAPIYIYEYIQRKTATRAVPARTRLRIPLGLHVPPSAGLGATSTATQTRTRREGFAGRHRAGAGLLSPKPTASRAANYGAFLLLLFRFPLLGYMGATPDMAATAAC